MIANSKYISLAATILCMFGFLPEVFSLIEAIYKNTEQQHKNEMWSIWIISSLLSTAYAFIINDTFIIINSITILLLNVIIFFLKLKYNHNRNKIKPVFNTDK